MSLTKSSFTMAMSEAHVRTIIDTVNKNIIKTVKFVIVDTDIFWEEEAGCGE